MGRNQLYFHTRAMSNQKLKLKKKSTQNSIKKNKTFKENLAINLHDPGLGDGSLDRTARAQATKEKTNWTSLKSNTLVLQRARPQ